MAPHKPFMQPQSILQFWFEELTPKQHFVKDAALDETIRARFGDTLEAAARCELFAWRERSRQRQAQSQVGLNATRKCTQNTPLLSHANPENVKKSLQINHFVSHGR